MAKTKTFHDNLMKRAKSFRPLEDKAASDMRKFMQRTKRDAEELVRRNMAAYKKGGKYIDSASAVAQAEATALEMERLLDAKLKGAGDKLVRYREVAYKKGALDVHESTKVPGLSGTQKSSLAGAYNQVNLDAAVAARTRPVLGISPNAAFNGVKKAAPKQVQTILSNAVLTGESTRETARKIAEAMDMSVHAAERIVRTNMNASYNDAARLYYESRPEIFAGYTWDAIMDDRTSPTCLMLHGSFYPLGAVTPGPPAHWNCRSVLLGVFKDGDLVEAEEGLKRTVAEYQKQPDGTIKQFFKQVPNNIAPESWLKSQPYEVVQDTLGSKLKADAFLRKNYWESIDYQVKLSDIVTPDLQVLGNKKFIERVWALVDDSWDRPDIVDAARQAGITSFKKKNKSAVLAEDKKAIKKAKFSQPQPAPDPEFEEVAGATSGKRPPVGRRKKTVDDWVKSLSYEQRDQWDDWFVGTDIEDMREALLGKYKGSRKDELLKWKQDLEKMAGTAPVYKDTIYRGINVSEDVAKKIMRSRTFENVAPNSTSKSFSVAENFATGGDNVPIVFEMRKNKYGVDVQKISGAYSHEREVFLPANTRFRIIRREKEEFGWGEQGYRIVMEAMK